MIKVVFFGTQEFGQSILASLIDNKNLEIVGVVTQPDRPVGRKQELAKSPVKVLTEQNNLPIFQPVTLKNFSNELPLADFFIVCQYGLIIPQTILDLPKNSCINVHTSLLPKYRGASPIQSALINGETTTGVTIMYMDRQTDHGKILAQYSLAITPDDTCLTLSKKMELLGADLLANTLQKIMDKKITPKVQDESQATYCKILTREDGQIDWMNKTAKQIYNLFRGTLPWPGIYTTLDKKRLKLLNIRPVDKNISAGKISVIDGQIFIGAKGGAIEILELQLEGKKPATAKVFLNGYQNLGGAHLPS